MQAFLIGPVDHNSTHRNNDAESHRITGLIADLLTEALDGDPTLHAIWYGDPPEGLAAEKISDTAISRPADQAHLRELLLRSIDPWHPQSCNFRSLLSCRAVTYGWDGQAFLILHTEDPTPVSPDPAIIVEPWPDLFHTDYLDGVALGDLRR
jgi:hypothetical protein